MMYLTYYSTRWIFDKVAGFRTLGSFRKETNVNLLPSNGYWISIRNTY